MCLIGIVWKFNDERSSQIVSKKPGGGGGGQWRIQTESQGFWNLVKIFFTSDSDFVSGSAVACEKT